MIVSTAMSLLETAKAFSSVLSRIEKNGGTMPTVTEKDKALFTANGSMVKFLSTFIIEPTIIVSKDIREEEISEKLATLNLDIFASYYLQTFNVLTNIHGFEAKTAFDILSSTGSIPTDKNILSLEDLGTDINILPISKETNEFLSIESRAGINVLEREIKVLETTARDLDREIRKKEDLIEKINSKDRLSNQDLRMLDKLEVDIDQFIKPELKEVKDKLSSLKEELVKLETAEDKKSDREKDEAKRDRSLGKRSTASIIENKGVSIPSIIQKEIEITSTVQNDNGKTDIIIPVLIKATVIYSDFSNILNMIDTNGRDKTFGYRVDEYRAGMISLGDLVFANDLVSKYKSNKLKDEDDLINFMESRSTKANMKLVSKGHVGFSKFYATLIITKKQLSIIESKLGGKISKDKYRDILMNQTKSLMINIVDTDWERVTIHTKDLKGTSDITYKAIGKRKGGSDSSELVDIFKAMSSNRAPSF